MNYKRHIQSGLAQAGPGPAERVAVPGGRGKGDAWGLRVVFKRCGRNRLCAAAAVDGGAFLRGGSHSFEGWTAVANLCL